MPEQFEPERYELTAPPLYHFAMDRRDFIGLLGGGILVVIAADAQESGGGRRRGAGGPGTPQEIGAWLHIGQDGAITVHTGKAEVGQNIRTSLSQAVAEELRCPIASVKLLMADTDLVPYDMGTFGSMSTPRMAPQLRRAAAAAREMLLDLAAEKWKTDRASLSVADGKVTSAGQAATFTELTQGSQLSRQIGRDVAPGAPAGVSVAKVNGRDIVTGSHRYASDHTRPGMLHGRIVRPATFNATLASVDAKAAEAMPGVAVVQDGSFVGVAAPTSQDAERAVAVIHAEWKAESQPAGKDLFQYLKSTAGAGRGGDTRGSMKEGLAAADIKLNQTYTVAYIAHTPLEPRAAVAEWNGAKLTVWTGSQRPFGVRSELAAAFGIPESNVRVIVPDTGSGYGGKHSGECAIEAARLAKAAGKPVKLVWTREEEFTWAYFRPAGVIEVASGVRKDGIITAWEFHNYNSGNSAIQTLYNIPNQRIEFHASKSPLRQGSYRGLAATANHFARESHMDELARAVKMDPLEFRLCNLKDERLRAVLEAAAEKFGWGKTKPAGGHGFGIAGGFEKGGYVATCAEVAVEKATRAVRIVRAVEAFECGAVVNPDHLRNQIEGSISMGIGGALFEAIEFDNGRILNPRFSKYRVPRFGDMPKIEVVLVDRKDLPSAGAGETPIVGIAAAVANAIHDAAGVRLRSMPMLL
jgi:isoquinoline 1-oxidoreductase